MREAPEAVADAVQEQMGCHDHWVCPDAQRIADAAWAAAYAAALRDAADRLMREADISRADLEVLLPSCHKRQCDCCHPTSDEAFSLVISRTRDLLRRWADEATEKGNA